MSDIPAETTNRLADYLIARYGIEEAAQLIKFTFARTEFGDGKYGKPLLPFDGRNTLRDALDEATDLSQYLMKKVMENEAIADLLERAWRRLIPVTLDSEDPLISDLMETEQLLRADCERRVPLSDEVIHEGQAIWARMQERGIPGPAERLAQMEGES